MSNKIIGENGEIQEIPLLKKGLSLFFWYLVGRYGGVLLIFSILAFIGGLLS
jgi:hypothetical protein